MQRLKKRVNTSRRILKEEGLISFIKHFFQFVIFKLKNVNNEVFNNKMIDVLFINGCSLSHPKRYRVDHQMEQLESNGLSVFDIDINSLNIKHLKYCRTIIIFRCPITPLLKEFILKARENNKPVFYDIDDLVIDTKYTNNIVYVKNMGKEEKKVYNDGVKRSMKTLELCDYVITTTEGMKQELVKYSKEVYINRNVVSDQMVELSDKALSIVRKDKNKIVLGYFSGSITHNPDFELISDSIQKIMSKYSNVYLKVVGIIEMPDKLKQFSDRIQIEKFISWKKLPFLIASVDINLAPIEKSVFNEAKSENKWVEAALCKVPTIASNCGAFKRCIKNGVTGILSNDDEWYNKIEELIIDEERRFSISVNAYKHIQKNYIAIYTGTPLANYIRSKMKKNFLFVLPSTNISGGVLVAIKHCQMLKKNGYDVTILSMDKNDDNITNKDGEIFVVSNDKLRIMSFFDTIIASLWSTLDFVNSYGNAKNKLYLVQNYETNFYKNGSNLKRQANATYCYEGNLKYITISKWCEEWLKEKFNKKVFYVPNGIDLSLFKYNNREKHNKIRILIEGNSLDYYKNVDESFKITNQLDRNKFEISYLSYAGNPKEWYVCDKFYHKVPYEDVVKIYCENDILIKSSILESFSYPPLEMMATGGVSVVLKNDGNKEYLIDGENCLFYKKGDINDAINKINMVIEDKDLHAKLIKNGLETAKKRNWDNIEKDIINLYVNDKGV